MQITKNEWTRIVGINLALLLVVYCAAIILTLCGNDYFALQFENPRLDEIEQTLRGWKIFPIVQGAFSSIETFIISLYVRNKKEKWWMPFSYFVFIISMNVILTYTIGYCPSYLTILSGIVFCILVSIKQDKWWKILIRLIIAIGTSLLFNWMIVYFRTSMVKMFTIPDFPSAFCLLMEYDLALALALLFGHLIETREKGNQGICQTPLIAGGFSRTSMKKSRKSSPNLNPKTIKRLKLLKARTMVEQTLALVCIAFVPWLFGKEAEFALVYVSFCLTRLTLGFKKSLHFKDESKCIGIGALCFIGLSYLTPDIDSSIIFSLCYGSFFALGLRLYWELQNLRLYKKASKSDNYATLYVCFKGDLSHNHIFGMMKLWGFDDETIEIIYDYMQKDKLDYLALKYGMSVRTINYKITDCINKIK
jgi:hypothetical protein